MQYKVIIADDSEEDLALITTALKGTTRFRIVHQARDGRQLIHYLERREPFDDVYLYPTPHVLLLDLTMPRFDGFQVLKWIKQHSFPIVAIGVTGNDSEEYITRAQNFGAAAVFMKPLTWVKVTQLVKLAEQMAQELAGQGS